MNEDRDDKDDIKRKTRNLSEKKRRDQFNMLVNELRLLISSNNRKMDKATVLKSAISFLKNHNDVTVRSRAHDVQDDWKPPFLSNEEFTYLVLEALEGFVMVISSTGRMCYVSETVTSLLGHNPGDIINKNIYDLTYEDDRSVLYNLLNNPTNVPETFQKNGKDNDISFQCHLRRGTLDPTEQPTYELIQFNGHFRTNVEDDDIDYVPAQKESKTSVMFICTGRLYTPQLIRDVSLVNPTRSEFASRHSLELKFLFLDHRAPPIIGYLPFEVLGTSGYDYYHFDDLQKVVTCHKALMQKGELTSCYYRFLTKGQQWIWLQTRFYITYHQWNSKPEFVVCTHRVVSYADMAKSAKQGNGAEAAPEPVVNRAVLEDGSQESGVSPSYVSDSNEAIKTNYAPSTHVTDESASGGSTTGTAVTYGTAPTMSASWGRSCRAYPNSTDNDSVSGESRNSQSMNETQKVYVGLVPQHSMGAQYLDPARFLHTVNVPENIAIALPNLPIVAPPNQAQRINNIEGNELCFNMQHDTLTQDQLQRKHGELQQLLVQQQEELRRLKDLLFISKFWTHTAY